MTCPATPRCFISWSVTWVAEKHQRDSEIDKLRLIIKQLQRGQFGRRSERLDADQLHLGLEELDADIARAESRQVGLPGTKVEQAEKPYRLAFPEDLPGEEVTLDVDGGMCRHCVSDGRPPPFDLTREG